MKILLIQPPMIGTSIINLANIGLASIAAVLKANGIEVEILDTAAEEISLDEIISKIRFIKPDIIGSGGQSPISFYSIRIFEKTKREISKGIYTLAGGPHFSFTDVESLETCPELDIVVRGEAEYSVLDICKRLEKERTLDDVKGITYRSSKGEIIRNPDREPIEDLDTLPFPAWELFPIEKYQWDGVKILPSTTSRGCDFNCNHCISWKMHKRLRLRSPKHIVDEMVYVKENFNIDTFFFHDDQTFPSREQLEGFLDELGKRDTKFFWGFETRDEVFYGYKDLWKRMKENGMHSVFFGLESPNDMVRKYYKKGGCTKNQIEEMLYYLEHKLDVIVNVYLVMGAPVETEQNIKETIEYAKYLCPKFCSLVVTTLLIPYPGTGLFKELKSKGLISTYDWSEYGSFDGTSVIKAKVPQERIRELFLSAWKGTYARPKVVIGIMLDLFSRNKFRRSRAFQCIKIAIRFLLVGNFIMTDDYKQGQQDLNFTKNKEIVNI